MNIKDLRTEELEILSTINDKLGQQIINDTVCEEVKNELFRRSNMLSEYVGKIFKQESPNGFDILYIVGRHKEYPILLYDKIFFRADDMKIEYTQKNILSNICFLDGYIEISKEEYDFIIDKINPLNDELKKLI